MGMFSNMVICRSHFGHLDLGRTTEPPSGQRKMHTLRNEPLQAPIANA